MIGQRIRYYRKTKGLTQDELAKGICSVSYLSKIENGDAKSSEDVIELLCERLGISPEEKQLDVNILGLLNEWHNFMISRKDAEAELIHSKIKEYLPLIEDPKTLIRYDIYLTRYYLSKGDFDAAKEMLNKVDKIDNTQLDIPLHFYHNFIKGLYYYLINEYNDSLHYLDTSESYLQQTPLTQIEIGVFYYNLALTHTALFHNTSVINYVNKALTIFDKEYNFTRSADCQILLGIVNRRINNYSQAIYHFNQAHKFAESFNDSKTLSMIFHNLGLVHSNQDESQKAIDYYLKSLTIKDQLNDSRKYLTYFLLAKEYFKINNTEESLEWISKMEDEIEHTAKNPQKEYLIHLEVLKYRLRDNLDKNYETLLKKEVIPFFQEKNIMEFVCEYSAFLADYYFINSQYKNASEYYKLALRARSKFT